MRISDWSSDVCSSDLGGSDSACHRRASGKRRPGGAAGAELRTPGHDAVGDAGSENRKTKQRQRRQRDRHCLIGVGRLTKRGAGELAEQGRADPGNDRKRHYLDARRNDVSEYPLRSEEHTSELQSLMRISYAVFCLKKK